MPAADLLDKHLAVSDYDCTMYTALISLIALTSCVLARPAEEPVAIVSQSQEGPNPDGSYKWNFEAANGIKAAEEGVVVNADTDDPVMSAQGSYSYHGDDGTVITLTYKADADGFQPEGAHLPTSPPIPEGIQRALDWIDAHPDAERADNA